MSYHIISYHNISLHGFCLPLTPQVVDTAKMSFYDQLKLVRGSNIIIGVHGAGLMFIMFAAEEVRRQRKCESRVKDEQREISKVKSRERSRDRGRCRERKCRRKRQNNILHLISLDITLFRNIHLYTPYLCKSFSSSIHIFSIHA